MWDVVGLRLRPSIATGGGASPLFPSGEADPLTWVRERGFVDTGGFLMKWLGGGVGREWSGRDAEVVPPRGCPAVSKGVKCLLRAIFDEAGSVAASAGGRSAVHFRHESGVAVFLEFNVPLRSESYARSAYAFCKIAMRWRRRPARGSRIWPSRPSLTTCSSTIPALDGRALKGPLRRKYRSTPSDLARHCGRL